MTRDLDPYGEEPARTLANPYGDPPPRPPKAQGATTTRVIPTDWHHHAACKGHPTDWWYPPPPKAGAQYDNLERAKALCASCPVRTPCLAEATASCDGFGIWGGASPPARATLRKRAKAAGVALEADAIAAWVDATDALGTAVA